MLVYIGMSGLLLYMKFLYIPETRTCNECSSSFTAYIADAVLCPKCRRNKKQEKSKEQEFIQNYYRDTDNQREESEQEDKETSELELPEIDLSDEDIGILDEIYIPPNRHCHDCGKPISNFRCEDCWKKWKIKNHIPLDDEYLNGIDK